MTLILLAIVWYVVGIAGFIYWWTNRNDLIADLNLITTVFLAGLLGVLTWIIGAYVSSPKTHKVIIKRRK